MPRVDKSARSQLVQVLLCTICLGAASSGVLPVLPIVVGRFTQVPGEVGIVTAAIALGTVALELLNYRLVYRVGVGRAILAGYAITTVGMAGLAVLPPLAAMVVIGLVLGVGMGIVVASTTIAVELLARPGGRGFALGLYGMAGTVPQIIAPAAMLFLLERSGPRPVFWLSTLVCALGLIAALGLDLPGGQESSGELFVTLRRPSLLLAFCAYLLVAITLGGVLSYSAFVVRGVGMSSATSFFVIFGVARVAARGIAGSLLDRVGEAWISGPSLVLVALGLAMLSLGGTWSVVAAITYGVGLGSVQTASLVSMLERVTRKEATVAGSLWNFAVDAGIGLGALTLAPLGADRGYPTMFMLLPVAAMAALGLRVFDWWRLSTTRVNERAADDPF